VVYACIDIGSNTTRLLVADAVDGRLRELLQQRAFTLLGSELARDRAVPAAKIAELADVVATQMRVARELGAMDVRAVATAAIRRAANRDGLLTAIHDATGLDVEVLTEDDEARLAFAGATRTLAEPPAGEIAVADVGGGSSEIAIGTFAAGVRWSASFRIGSGFLADSYLRSDPPAITELEAVRVHVDGTFEGLDLPLPELAVAVGGSATSLRRLVGAELDHETLERGVRVLASTPIAELARRFELEPERVRLLPAGILILEAISDRLGCPLQIGRGGVREGAILERMAEAGRA
jgi:exopolyphosphatase/guanosine-5'-triphosphate,3'-diphosphate pyrophosphatase